jgi:hypothetical protein
MIQCYYPPADVDIADEFCTEKVIAKLEQGLRSLGTLSKIGVRGRFRDALLQVPLFAPQPSDAGNSGKQRVDARKQRRIEQEMKYLKMVRPTWKRLFSVLASAAYCSLFSSSISSQPIQILPSTIQSTQVQHSISCNCCPI